MKLIRSLVSAFVLAVAVAASGAPARLRAAEAATPAPFDVKEHYTKYEHRIPMRDGARLYTAVYVPKDAATPHPFLMVRTPYSVSPYGADEYPGRVGPGENFLKAGYIFVVQDVRGRHLSESTFIEATPHRPDKRTKADVDESTDTYDTVEWLLKHVPNHNGRVGIWGVSYPGFYTAAGIIDTHPAIKAASPQAPVTDFYLNDDWYHGGAFMLAHNFGFLIRFKPHPAPTRPPKTPVPFDYGTQDGYEFFLQMGPLANAARHFEGKSEYWDAHLAHPTYDEYWKSRAIWRHLKNIRCAVLTVGGWFDAEDLMGPLLTHRTIGQNNPGIYNGLVMGPWVHGGWSGNDGRRLGSVDFAANTAEFYREKILFPFFEQHLKDKSDAKLPVAYVFETGTNVWRQYSAWPAPGARPRTLYFHGQGGLAFDAPDAATGASDSYVSDPARPVPFIGYTALGMPQEYMVADQRFAARRPDVLVYATAPLEEDVTLAGPVSPRLFVATTGTDSDWVVKLIDVYPPDRSNPPAPRTERPLKDVPPPGIELAGYQQLVRGEPLRGKFRKSFEQPVAMVPGQVEAVNFTMPDVNHTFRRGHRIMIQVQSSWFPLFDRNPQTFVNIPTAKAGDFRAATQHVHRSKTQPSGVEVHVLPQPGESPDGRRN
ncbi:MAG: CocE/NonD family hydrolase [Verrucomicrobia bacterium]|nr:CocE/NonD family hydrolase [Verrucomicrobiota bacterium]